VIAALDAAADRADITRAELLRRIAADYVKGKK